MSRQGRQERKRPHRITVVPPRCRGCGALLGRAYKRRRYAGFVCAYVKCRRCGDNTVIEILDSPKISTANTVLDS